MGFRRSLIWLTLLAQFAATPAQAGPHDEGLSAGRAANVVSRPAVNAGRAAEVVPGFSGSAPQTSLYRQPNLNAQGRTRLTQCATQPDDPECQALVGANRSANLPRPGVAFDDPAVAAARAINRSPSSVLGSLADYYAGCSTQVTTRPETSAIRSCLRRPGIGDFRMLRRLTVDIERVPNCSLGEWPFTAQAQRNALDTMSVEAQCRIRDDGLQRFRFDARGQSGSCVPTQTLDLPTEVSTASSVVTALSPHWSHQCQSPFVVVMQPGSGCTSGRCTYRFDFGTPRYDCPAGQVTGDTLVTNWGEWVAPGSATAAPDRCFALSAFDPETGCQPGHQMVQRNGLLTCAVDAGPATVTGAVGWTLPLSFDQPAMVVQEHDRWEDLSSSLEPGSRCAASGAPHCTDGPATRIIDGHPVTRACWQAETPITCHGAQLADDCGLLERSGCQPLGRTCREQDPATGACLVEEQSFRCAVPAETASRAGTCPSDVFCLGENCFDIRQTPDGDFARSLSMLEAGREAGVYLDPDQLRVFKGEDNRCRDRLLKNCCSSDGSGAGMHNQSVFGTGSRLVYDILMNAENRQFLTQGVSALLLGGGFSGSFTSYGVTVAVNGTALPAGSAVLHAGESLVIAFDPWSLAISVIFYAVMQLASCSAEEGKLAMKEGAGLCHRVGSWCSSCLRVLGSCVSCIEETTSKCCFNSKLARIINEQGRTQLGRGWGDVRSPDCGGFTVAELQSLDFGAMDLTEFYASLVPSQPNLTDLQGRSADRLPSCYFGQGRCQ